MTRVLFVITEDWALISHRLHFVIAARDRGFEVAIATKFSRHKEMLSSLGVKTYDWNLSRKSINPFSELKSLFLLYRIISEFKPNLVHAVAQKPLLYAGILKRLGLDFSFVGALGGVGYIFNSVSLKAKILRPLISKILRFVLVGGNTAFILQNKHNISLFEKLKIVNKGQAKLIQGSGVEISKYLPTPFQCGVTKIILPARMLWDKGVAEFVEAARSIKEKGLEAEFILVGDIDEHNSASVKQIQIDDWISEGIVKQMTRQDNMFEIYSFAHVVCLPSYHEGLPKVLTEAASCARPIVTFDIPGCREIVTNGINGFLVPFQDQSALEKALVTLINEPNLRESMGFAGRKIAETKFCSDFINDQTFLVWEEVIKK